MSDKPQPQRSEPLLIGKHIDIEYFGGTQPPATEQPQRSEGDLARERIAEIAKIASQPLAKPPATDATAELPKEDYDNLVRDAMRWRASQRPDATAEWTPELVEGLVMDAPWPSKVVADAHNAALAAERTKFDTLEAHLLEKLRLANIDACNNEAEANDLRQQLATERENSRQYAATALAEREKVLQAQAAIAEHDKHAAEICHYHVGKTVDLSALDKHDAEVRKPLVDALEGAKSKLVAYFNPHPVRGFKKRIAIKLAKQIIDDALAKYPLIEVDRSALDKHDAEARRLLVDALSRSEKELCDGRTVDAIRTIRCALAKYPLPDGRTK